MKDFFLLFERHRSDGLVTFDASSVDLGYLSGGVNNILNASPSEVSEGF